MTLRNDDEVLSDFIDIAGGRVRMCSALEECAEVRGLATISDSAVVESAIR